MINYVGIDVSQLDFKVALLQEDGCYQVQNILNTEAAILVWAKTLPANSFCILEATGVYHRVLAYSLAELGLPCAVINPKQSANFSKIKLDTIKNDEKDAIRLSQYGQTFQPKAWQASPANIRQMQQKRRVLEQYSKQSTALKNVLHSLVADYQPDKTALSSVESTLCFLESQMAVLEKEIQTISEEDFKKYFDLLCTIKGIGSQIAGLLISLTNGFQDFQNAKQFAKFIGIAPTEASSGTSVRRKSHINQGGQAILRAKLYMAAQAALRGNKACRQLFDRLKKNGKSGKQALVAVMNKLIRQAFAVALSGQIFDNEYYTKFN